MKSDPQTAPIGTKTVTVLGSNWPDGRLWAGFDWSRAELRSHSLCGGDYHLGVPWAPPDDRQRFEDDPDIFGIYRLRLKRGWKSFVQAPDGTWLVSKAPAQKGTFGTPPEGQVRVIKSRTRREPERDRLTPS